VTKKYYHYYYYYNFYKGSITAKLHYMALWPYEPRCWQCNDSSAVFTAVIMKSQVFWDFTPWWTINCHLFGGT